MSQYGTRTNQNEPKSCWIVHACFGANEKRRRKSYYAVLCQSQDEIEDKTYEVCSVELFVKVNLDKVPMWPVESREMYRKGTAMHPPTTMHPPRFPPPLAPPPRYQFTARDLDRCLYGKQDIRVVQLDSKNGESGSGVQDEKGKPAKWCDMCQEVRFGECPTHGPLPSLRSTISLSGPKTYAISTFPDEVGLCISSIPLAGYGVFAKHFIPLGTWIGPYEGRKVSIEDTMGRLMQQNDSPFMWEIYENGRLGFFLDASDENSSSWMRFIQCARHKGEQNLYVFQYYGSVYYRAFKDIPVGTELLVWYDEKYPQYFGLPTEIRDMSNCSVENIQAPMEVTNKTTEPDQANLLGHGKQLKQVTITSAPPRPVNDQNRPSATVNPLQPMSFHDQSGNIRYSQPPVNPPPLSQAPGLQTFDPRVARAQSFAGPRSQFYTGPFPPKAASQLAYVTQNHPSSAANLRSIVKATASTSQSYLTKPSVLPPPSSMGEPSGRDSDKAGHGEWQNWKCPHCGKTFGNVYLLQTHSCPNDPQRTHSFERTTVQVTANEQMSEQDKPYKCGVCTRLFPTSGLLSQHMRAHANEKTVECQNCGKLFNTMNQLVVHQKTPGDCT